ncbi:MAG: hypothetical protein R6V72_23590 [Cyclobacterium sp.]|uniref:hypothetical protein n=1 Tax=Cyclobacterium sp. TaxID=1966343 RepID=UPI0039704739
MQIQEGVFIGLLIFFIFKLNQKWAGAQGYTRWETHFLQVLGLYHLLFALFFYGYILHYGGDSSRYWELSSFPGKEAGTWSSYWGTGTAFIQWINYPFSRILDLGFFSGCLLYAGISFLGFAGAFDLIKDQFQANKGTWPGKYGLLVLFLPNVHFWSAGPGKEGLLFTGLVLVLLGIKYFPSRAWLMVPGLLLTLMVRPIQGLVLTIAVLAVLPFHPALKLYRKKLLPWAGSLIFAIFAYRWIQGSLVYGFNFKWIGMIIDWQNAYLDSFAGQSSIPMRDYSLPEKFMALWFRPYLWEVKDFWTFAAALENTLVFLVAIPGIWVMAKRKFKIRIPTSYRVVLLYGALMSVIFILALNNLGILMRMKSIFTLFMVSFLLGLVDRPLKENSPSP